MHKILFENVLLLVILRVQWHFEMAGRYWTFWNTFFILGSFKYKKEKMHSAPQRLLNLCMCKTQLRKWNCKQTDQLTKNSISHQFLKGSIRGAALPTQQGAQEQNWSLSLSAWISIISRTNESTVLLWAAWAGFLGRSWWARSWNGVSSEAQCGAEELGWAFPLVGSLPLLQDFFTARTGNPNSCAWNWG